jgi:hypothetical protein
MVQYILYKQNVENNKFFLGIAENKAPKNVDILFKSQFKEEFDDYCRVIHKNTVNDPNRVWDVPSAEKPQKKRVQQLDTRKKIREYRTGKQWDDSTRQKISSTLKKKYRTGERQPAAPNKGQRFDREHRMKMKLAAMLRKRVTCEHCGTTCAVNMYVRHHGHNCRMNW